MFQLKEVREVAFTNSNPRSEFHGEDHVRAIDIAMQIEGSNDLLDLIESGLRAHHYMNREADSGQQLLVDALRHLPDLRFPKLTRSHAYAKGEHWKGYRFVIDYGLDERAVDLSDCVLTGLRYELQEGGSVTIGFTVQFNGDELNDDRLYGRLAGLATLGEGHVQLLAPATLLPVRKGWRSGRADTANADGGGELFEEHPNGQEREEHPEGEFAQGSPEAALLESVQQQQPEPLAAPVKRGRGKRAAAGAPLQ
jgi:hypothetical protein